MKNPIVNNGIIANSIFLPMPRVLKYFWQFKEYHLGYEISRKTQDLAIYSDIKVMLKLYVL